VESGAYIAESTFYAVSNFSAGVNAGNCWGLEWFAPTRATRPNKCDALTIGVGRDFQNRHAKTKIGVA